MKSISILLIVLVLALVGMTAAMAQSGDGYELSWFTVNGGSYVRSTNNGFSLGGTIGQTGIQTPASGAGYDLRDGFARPVCSPVAVPVTLTCSGSQAHLNWTPQGANMAYDIYRATTPYMTLELALKRATVSGSTWTDPTVNTCGDVGANYYYGVRSTCMGGHADAGEVGEFDFNLVAGN